MQKGKFFPGDCSRFERACDSLEIVCLLLFCVKYSVIMLELKDLHGNVGEVIWLVCDVNKFVSFEQMIFVESTRLTI